MPLPPPKLEDLVMLIRGIDAELDDIAAAAPALLGIRNHVRLAQDMLRDAKAELLRAAAIERAPADRDAQAALQ